MSRHTPGRLMVGEERRPMQTAASNYRTCDINVEGEEQSSVIVVHTEGPDARERARDYAEFIAMAVNDRKSLVDAIRGLLMVSLPGDISGQRHVDYARDVLARATGYEAAPQPKAKGVE